MRRGRLRPALVVAVILMLLWLGAYWRLSPMRGVFFQPSGAGLRGLALYVRGQHAEAGRAYLSARGRAGEYDHDHSGYAALRAGDLERAVSRAETTLLLVPSAIQPELTLAEVALQRGRPAEAMTRLQRVFERAPNEIDALYLAALAEARLGHHGPAIDAIHRGLRTGSASSRDTVLFRFVELAGDLDAGRERPLALLANVWRYIRIYDGGAADLVIAYARAAIAAGDRPADAYLALGIAHDKRYEHDLSLRAFLSGVEADPRHAESLRWASVKAHDRSDTLLEYRMAKAAFEAAPADPFHLTRLERVVMGTLGDAHTMVALMERAVDVNPANGRAHEHLARAAASLGDLPRAKRHAERARALRGRSASATDPEVRR